MEIAVSAAAGELVSRFVSFLADKYHSSGAHSEEKQLKRLQQLLLRARTVVEEADGRYITNSGMLAQLKVLADAMYRGYWALGASGYMSLEEPMEEEGEVRNPSPLKRFHMVHHAIARTTKSKATYLVDLQGALESLEDGVAGMTEFLLLLGGCDRMLLRRPYDAYLYNDGIMFGRHTEKQKLLNFMLQHGGGGGGVLPIIGAPAIGKRTLVAHVCRDERVRSHFSSILHLNGDSLCRIADHAGLMSSSGKILVVVELAADVDDEDWAKFRSTVETSMGNGGSKVIIVSRLKDSERLGTVQPIFLNTMAYEEFSYLFKTLAFGSADPAQHPRLARIADEFARELRSEWSLVAANILADLMRRNLSVRFWLCMLGKLRRVVERNVSMFGEHPKNLFQGRHQLDVTDFVPAAASPPLRIVHSCTGGPEAQSQREALPRVRLGDLVMDPGVRPQGDFNMVSWESRVPPYTCFLHFVPNAGVHDPHPDVAHHTPLPPRRKRPALPP